MSISIVQGGPRGQVRVADSSATIVRSAALGPPVSMKARLARIKSGSNLDTLVRKHGALFVVPHFGVVGRVRGRTDFPSEPVWRDRL